MRALFLLPLLAVLAGCDSLYRPGADGFEAPPGGIAAFEADTATCHIRAEDAVTYDQPLADTTRYARNRAFNRAYGRCMTARGYRQRPYLRNVLPAL